MHICDTVWTRRCDVWRSALPGLLDAAGLPAALRSGKRILIKPNLVENLPPPITTPVGLVEALLEYLRENAPGGVEIVIGEGCGSKEDDTWRAFAGQGYVDLSQRCGVPLIDLNTEKLVSVANPHCSRWPQMFLPAIVFESFLLSLPVLKAHSLAGVTLTMKNMMGLAPPAHYQQGGHWKKAAFHHRIQEAIFDLNRYRAPDFTLLDATVGMCEAHLWGATCDPPPGLLVAGYDPVAVDAFATGLLGRDWRQIGHIRLADGVLGTAAGTIVEVA
ncbi:MAG: DUF362 domain-containing protein [Desulfobulbaceae bacterium]|nr:DUF362 domain-containing protein [Desulfobulbaceae bacterium]